MHVYWDDDVYDVDVNGSNDDDEVDDTRIQMTIITIIIIIENKWIDRDD